MQSSLRRRSREQGSSEGGFCEVISTLAHDLTKARNQLVRLMHQVSPGGARLYGGYSVPQKPLRLHTPCGGYDARIRQRTPASGNLRLSSANPNARVPPGRSCRPVTVHGANRFGPSEQRTLPRPQQTEPKSTHNKIHRPFEGQQQQLCNRNDTSDAIDLSERSAQRDSTCVNITFDTPDAAPATRQSQYQRRDSITPGGSKPVFSQAPCNPARLQGGGCSRRHHCVGTQFATLLQDVTSQLRVRRLAADVVKTP